MLNLLKKLIALNEKAGVTGRVTIRGYKAGTKELVYEKSYDNLVVSSSGHGRNIVARRLGSDNTYSGNITHGELGTGTQTVIDSRTDLATAAERVAVVSDQAVANDVVDMRFFYPDATTGNATYTEFGTFIDGTIALGTGQLFNYLVLGSPYVKTAGIDTTVEVTFTINP